MASQASTRKSFIDSSIQLARSYNFYGLDLDWEYPSTATEFTKLGLLLDEWRAAVASEATSSGNTPLLLVAAFYYSSNYYGLTYPIQDISNSLDWVNVMAYDFIAPVNADDNGIFAPANGAAISSTGAIAYSQINNFISQNSATAVYNSTFVTDYCYSGTTWIGYDDTQSISTKVTYAKGNGLLGYFAWQLGQDPNFVLSQAVGSSPMVISDPTTKTMTRTLFETDLRELLVLKKKLFSRTLRGISVEEEVDEVMKTVGFGSKTVSFLGERCEVGMKSGSGMLSLLVAGGFGSAAVRFVAAVEVDDWTVMKMGASISGIRIIGMRVCVFGCLCV
nr:isoform 2 of chitotriosidase-1 [Quercus suber]